MQKGFEIKVKVTNLYVDWNEESRPMVIRNQYIKVTKVQAWNAEQAKERACLKCRRDKTVSMIAFSCKEA